MDINKLPNQAELRGLIERYGEGIRLMEVALNGMNAEAIAARPQAGRWSSGEVICHVVDFEPVMADRMKRIIALDNPLLFAADEHRFMQRLAYAERIQKIAVEIALYAACRRQMLTVFESLESADWVRTGVHNERGKISLRDVLELAVRHTENHLAFVSQKRELLGLPGLDIAAR